MKSRTHIARSILVLPFLVLALTGCGGGGGTVDTAPLLLDGTATSEGIYFSPLRAPEDEAILADETINLDVDGETVTVQTDSRGRFQLRLRNGSGDCEASGGGENNGKQYRYGGNGRFGSGERIPWNFVDNNGDGVCDNTLEVVLQ